MKRLAFVLVCSLVLSACVSAGVQVDPNAVRNFVKGQTTYSEVVATLGQPTSNTITSDGRQIIVYTYVQMQTRPETFIPYVGLFVGGADTKSSSASFVFDRTGTLQDYSSSTSQLGAGTGLEAGTGFNERTPDQPRQSPTTNSGVVASTPIRHDFGVSGVNVTASSSAAIYMRDPHGVFVQRVTNGSPAANAGIQAGDIITSFSGLRVDTIEQLTGIVSTTAAGSVVKIGINRKGAVTEIATQL